MATTLAGLSFVEVGAWVFFVPIAGLVALVVPVALIGQGRQTLVVDDRHVTFSGFRKAVTVGVDKVEMLRVDERTMALDIISDDVTVRAHLPSVEAAAWVRDRVQNHLRERARSSAA